MIEDDEYGDVRGTYRYRKGSRADPANETPEAWSRTESDGKWTQDGDAEFISDESDIGDQSETAPDISALVPLVLVALAVGFVGRTLAKQRAGRGGSAGPAPAGWYELSPYSPRLRYWDGAAWTDDYAGRDPTAPAIPADWYPDPASSTEVRYWDGRGWTHHVAPSSNALATPADWYPDPADATQLRYWNGTAWTHHVTTR